MSTFTHASLRRCRCRTRPRTTTRSASRARCSTRRLYLNATVFNADYYGFQTSVTSTLPDGMFLTLLNSVGHLQTRGREDRRGGAHRADLSLNGAFAYTDATVQDFPNGPCFNGQTLAQGCYVDATNNRVQDLKGKRLNNVPEYKFNVGGHIRLPLCPARRSTASWDSRIAGRMK